MSDVSKRSRDSYVLELPLVVKPGEDRVLIARLEAGRRLYNAVLCDALKRLKLMRESKAWQASTAMPKASANPDERKARNDALHACCQHFGFTEYDLHRLAIAHKNDGGFRDRLGAHETQKIATSVWKGVREYSFGKRGRPRFKGMRRPLHSVESKTNKAGIRWKRETGCVEWIGLCLPVRMPTSSRDPYMHEALEANTRYCRIVWRNVRGKRRWFVQLVQEGLPPATFECKAPGAKAGVDVGPSTIAIVTETAVALERFAPSVDQPWAEIRRIQRAMDRSIRATNPHCCNADGTWKKGARITVRSPRYLKLRSRLADAERRLAAGRKRDHGDLANRILERSNVIRTESLSYLSFQRCYGRSVKVRAPGAFMDLLNRKAERAGGKLETLNTWRLCMSQYDHVTGSRTKKPLKQRWHRLGDTATVVQRDCYSAFLVMHVEEGSHNPSRLHQGWATAEPLLRRAGLCVDQSASGKAPAFPTVAMPSERIARRRRLGKGQNPDV